MENVVIGPKNSPFTPYTKKRGNNNESPAQSHQQKFAKSAITTALTQSSNNFFSTCKYL